MGFLNSPSVPLFPFRTSRDRACSWRSHESFGDSLLDSTPFNDWFRFGHGPILEPAGTIVNRTPDSHASGVASLVTEIPIALTCFRLEIGEVSLFSRGIEGSSG